MLTLVREVTYDAESASLLFNPIQEISLLRKDLLYSGDKIFVQSASLVQVLISPFEYTSSRILATSQGTCTSGLVASMPITESKPEVTRNLEHWQR